MIVTIACFIAGASAAAALLMNIYRLVIGPDTVDRVLALDTMTINAIALVLVGGMISGNQLFFEAALLFAMVGFLATVAFCRFMLRGDVIE